MGGRIMKCLTERCIVDRKIVQLLIKGKSFNQISKEIHVSKVRIKKIKEMAIEAGHFDGRPLPPVPEAIFEYKNEKELVTSDVDEQLLEHIDWMKECREAGWHLISIYEGLPILVSKSSFYRFIERHGLNSDKERGRCRIKVIGEINHKAGEALLLDWGKMTDVMDGGKKRTLWFLAGVLGFSRFLMTRLVWDNKLETTLKAIQSMFVELGGIPERVISDNPKCFSIEASKYEPLLNVGFERFCCHFDTIPEILPPYSPQKKGKVERAIPYIRRLFESYGNWEGIDHAQNFIDKKMKIANERTHGTTRLRPVDVFHSQEASKLGPLPPSLFEIEEYSHSRVRKDGCVRFQNKYYSAGKENIGQKAFLIGNGDTVEIYIKGKLIETHSKITDAFKSKSVKRHHMEPFEQIIKDEKYYIDQAQKIGPHAEVLIQAMLLAERGFIDLRKIWGILNLPKDYLKDSVNDACKQAYDCGQLNYRTVKSFLEHPPEKKDSIPPSVENKFIRKIKDYLDHLDLPTKEKP